MVRITEWFMIGAYTLFSATYAMPQPVVPLLVRERAARTSVITLTTTGGNGHVKTITTTETISNTRKKTTTTHSGNKTTSTTTHKGHTTTSTTTHKGHTTTSSTTTHKGKTTTSTTSSPTSSMTPGVCAVAAGDGGAYIAPNGALFDINCGATVNGGTPYSTTSLSTFSDCINLCSTDAKCDGLHYNLPNGKTPGQCFLYDAAVKFVASSGSNAAQVISHSGGGK